MAMPFSGLKLMGIIALFLGLKVSDEFVHIHGPAFVSCRNRIAVDIYERIIVRFISCTLFRVIIAAVVSFIYKEFNPLVVYL